MVASKASTASRSTPPSDDQAVVFVRPSPPAAIWTKILLGPNFRGEALKILARAAQKF